MDNSNLAGGWERTVRACLKRMLASPPFAHAERQQRFLTFVVDAALTGQADRLKGYTIGIEVFDREADFDPAVDAIVRVEAARLRAKLREYYDGAGATDCIRFELPKGTYAMQITRQERPAHAMRAAKREAPASDDASALLSRAIEGKASLAVLPFVNMSANPEQDYFADGITDTLITELSRLPGLFVISRHSSFVYKGLSKRAEDIGRELGISYLLVGSIQRATERVRINAQLVDTVSGADVWAERYDRDLGDIFALQDDVTSRIASVLRIKLMPGERERAARGGTTSLEAHDCLLRGLGHFWLYTRDSTEQARRQFERAIDLDSAYAVAHAWLARCLVFQWIMFWEPAAKSIEPALKHAQMAVDLDERVPYAHAVLCWARLWSGQGEAAISAGWTAVTNDPNNADAHVMLSYALIAAGRGEEALHYIDKGMRLNPHPSAYCQNALGMCYLVLEEYDKAIAALKRGTELTHVFVPCHYWLCMIYTLLGRDDHARAEREVIRALTGDSRPVLQPFWIDEDLKLRMHELARIAGLA